MSIPTLSGIPLQIDAGSTVLFTENFGDYPVADWTAKLVINMGPAAPIVVDATTSGTDFLFTIAYKVSAGIPYGEYDYSILCSTSTQRAVAKTGILTVLPDLSQAIPPTAAENMVTLLEGALATLAASTNSSVSFNGQSFSRANISDYQRQVTYWKAQVIAEQNKLNAQRGAQDPGRIATRFVPIQDGCDDGFLSRNGYPRY